MKPTNKPTKPLPSWIVVTAKDPKLKQAIEEKLARDLATNQPKK